GLEGGFRRETEKPPRGGALVILLTDDLDAAERSVREAGGEITARHSFPGGERFHFLDPGGNELAVWVKLE
ncbi:MAG: VOC family protein, partial [Pseudomonadota bacterium]